MSFLESENLKAPADQEVVRAAKEKALNTIHGILCRERKAAMVYALEVAVTVAKASDSIEDVRKQLNDLLEVTSQLEN
jgi:hypothetical protein